MAAERVKAAQSFSRCAVSFAFFWLAFPSTELVFFTGICDSNRKRQKPLLKDRYR